MNKHSRLIIIVLIIIFSTVLSAYAVDLGTPEILRKDAESGIDLGYFQQKSKWKPNDSSNWLDAELTQAHFYAQLNYSASRKREAYIKLGIADLESEKAFDFPSPKDFQNSYKPFASAGGKIVFINGTTINLGSFIQGTIYSNYQDQATETISEQEVSIKINYKNLWNILAGLSVQTKLEDLILYGGYFACLSQAKVKSEITVSGNTISSSTNYKEKNNNGFFLGLTIPAGDTFNINLEFQYKNALSFGIALRDTF